MKIDYAIVSSDRNKFYYDFWEPCKKVWHHHIGIKPLLVYISDKDRVTEKQDCIIHEIKEIKGFSDNLKNKDIIEFEDTGVVSFRLHSGALGTIHHTINSYGKNMEGSLTVFAEKGTVKVGGQYLNTIEYQNIEGIELIHEEGNKPNDYGKYVGSMSNHGEVYENVIDVLQNDAEIVTNSFEGMKVVEMIERIYFSYKD